MIQWNKLDYWHKGATIGLGYGIISVLLFKFVGSLPDLLAYLFLYHTYGIWFQLADGFGINETFSLVLTALIYSAIGALIGFSIGKLKKK